MTTDWIPWNIQQPQKDQDVSIIFYDHITMHYFMYFGKSGKGKYWFGYNNMPIAWMPFILPQLPEKYKKHNNAMRSK